MLRGIVRSHTVIRLAGKAHAANAPFVLLLVELEDGRRVLGHFQGDEPPPIDTRVLGRAAENTPPIFAVAEERT